MTDIVPVALPPGVTVEFPESASATLHDEAYRVVSAVVALGGAVGWQRVPSPGECAEWLDSVIGRAPRDGGLAAVRRNGRLEALGTWLRFGSPVLAQNAEIRKVMTHPDARGHGLARVAVAALVEHARAAGVEVLLLDARGNNHAAQALYESMGWVEYGRIPDFIGVGNERWDRVCYYLALGAPSGVIRHGANAVGPGASSRR